MMDIAQTAPETLILAEDEASLYLQATTTAVWAARGQRPQVRVHPNRDKVSFYGTLNLHTGQAVATREETMNGEATARHLEKVLATYPDVPILLLWDRARWHGGPMVRALLRAHPRLEAMSFPTAAPELNPQEMVLKATRAAISTIMMKDNWRLWPTGLSNTWPRLHSAIQCWKSTIMAAFVPCLTDFSINRK